MSDAVSLRPMFCIRCQSPLAAQPEELVWVCPNCGQGQILTESGLAAQTIRYTAGLQPGQPGKPIWVAQGQAALQREIYGKSFFGGNQVDDMQAFWAQPRWFFIPAYELPLEKVLEVGAQMLRQPPPMQEVSGPLPFYPVTVSPEDARALAEFIVMAVEAGRSDKLKKLEMQLELSVPELWIFP